MPDLLQLAWFISIGAEGLLLVRLLSVRLYKGYPLFCALLAGGLLRSAALLLLTPEPHSYGYLIVWRGTEAVIIGLQILAVYESYSRVRGSYLGLGSFGQHLLLLFLGAAVLLCVLSLTPDLSSRHWDAFRKLPFLVKRAISTVLALELLLSLGFFTWLKNMTLPPNVTRHSRILAAFFTLNALAYFPITASIISDRASAILFLFGTAVVFLLWAICMTPTGEESRALSRMPDAQARAIDARFARLVRFAKSRP